jgi:hypothetical protein
MARVIRENNHSKERHQKIVDEMLTMITESIARTLNPGVVSPVGKYFVEVVSPVDK